MLLVDSHCHLFYEGIYENLAEKIRIAKLADVKYLLTVSTGSSNIHKNIEISKEYENVCCSIGIHPHDFSEGYSVEEINSLLTHEKVVAIGEVGLDYHYQDSTPKQEQRVLFNDMLKLSEHSDLPYIIHARECFPDVLDIMTEYPKISAVFHCYTDSLDNAKKILDMGHLISFSGLITFKKCDSLRDVLRYVPEDRFLVETDCPYLAPEPFRGIANEPAHIRTIAECAATIRGVSIEKLAEITTNNFFSFFKKSQFLLEKN